MAKTTVAFTSDEVSGEVQPITTVYDMLQRDMLFRRLESALKAAGGIWDLALEGEWWMSFPSLIVATVRETLVGFELPSLNAGEEELLAAYERYSRLDGLTTSAWTAALADAVKTANERALLPAKALLGEEKKDMPLLDGSSGAR